jgi:hypothetical protein
MKQQASLMVYTQQITPRVSYAFSLLFRHILQVEYILTDHIEEYLQYQGAKISYTSPDNKIDNNRLPAHTLLFEQGIHPVDDLKVGQYQNTPILFPFSSPDTLLPFDLPAMAFYLASRYEEYLPFNADHLGRFPAAESLAAKHGFLHQPLINHWTLHLGAILRATFPDIEINLPAARFNITFDIDYTWAYKNRPCWLTLIGTLRDLLDRNFSAVRQRWRVLTRKEGDPFYSFEQLYQWHKENALPMQFFFLLADYGKYDKNTNPQHAEFIELIHQISKTFPVGIHPSFASNKKPHLLSKEIARLAAITQQPVHQSRQHFLMLQFPNTYQQLIAEGIQEDYSMGFAHDFGFRASMATPFPWYDLASEKKQDLMIHPFAVMDVTLKDYLKLQPEEAVAACRKLYLTTMAVKGEFTILWHNSSFSTHHGWQGWRTVFEKILSFATELPPDQMKE